MAEPRLNNTIDNKIRMIILNSNGFSLYIFYTVSMKIFGKLNKPLFTISLGKLEFRPALVPGLVTIALLYLLVSLGQWQLHRAEFKQNLEQMVEKRSQLQPIALNQLYQPTDELQYRPVKAWGRFDQKHQILLDNRVFNQQVGYHVYTPLIREHGPAILVDRGWIKQGRTRQQLPEIKVDQEITSVTGMLNKPPSAGLVLAENVNQYDHWPGIAQFIDLTEIEKTLGYPLYPMVLVLDGDQASALKHEPIHFRMSSDKHLGYAFQWFGLAVALLIIFFVVNTKRESKHNE
jgi:surfeit locus 1 family protein